jgi:hypothetical protein
MNIDEQSILHALIYQKVQQLLDSLHDPRRPIIISELGNMSEYLLLRRPMVLTLCIMLGDQHSSGIEDTEKCTKSGWDPVRHAAMITILAV